MPDSKCLKGTAAWFETSHYLLRSLTCSARKPLLLIAVIIIILLVDSTKNSLLVFSADDGHLIAECAREGLCNPCGIAVDLMGRILKADASNQIKVF